MSGLPRVLEPELMDHPEADPGELERSLADLRHVNRWLGGRRVMLRALGAMVGGVAERPVRVLDVATGSADLPLAIARWGRRRGVEVRVTATDLHARTLEVARDEAAAEPWVRVERADALDLPYSDGHFHIAICSTALHHFDDAGAERLLREMARVASRGVVVSDLSRSRPALWGTRLLAATLWRRHPITRHDAPVSVRAAYTPAELRLLAQRAGLRGVRVRPHPVFRLSLVADGTGEGA